MNLYTADLRSGGPEDDYATLAVPARLPITLGPVRNNDLAYCRSSWAEGFKHSPDAGRMSWQLYKRHVVPELQRILYRDDTQVLAAYLGADICGWIAYAPGRRVSTVHWVHTRCAIWDAARCTNDGCIMAGSRLIHGAICPGHFDNLEKLRKRGVMSALVDAAPLGDRIVYTHRGPKERNARVTSDEWIVPWLRRRGINAAYMPYEEWSK